MRVEKKTLLWAYQIFSLVKPCRFLSSEDIKPIEKFAVKTMKKKSGIRGEVVGRVVKSK